ncbi:WEB family protein At2g38370-like [Chenopodium quinoa]|uniref:WEB family protein At2g38370-like n=1 Tax=Chenopodium quinoa TaxID=63459 RepID=UPI000B790443|nr:WEB family protein At2g38370-like [Chenopodium quinoa]
MGDEETLGFGDSGKLKGEIDTSAPFESVKEAVTKFGGLGFWKPVSNLHKSTHSFLPGDVEEIDVAKVEEQAAELEKELILKEKDTFEVLKELEATKRIVEELKSKLQKEEYEAQVNVSVDGKPSIVKEEEEEDENNPNLSAQKLPEGSNLVPSSTPGLILMELKQAKLNLTKTTSDLAEIRASVESYNKKIERERVSLEKTRERLRSNTLKVSSLEEEINHKKSKLEDAKEANNGSKDIAAELQRLSDEAEDFKKKGETAKSEVMKVMSEIEQTKAKVKTAEFRLVAARKMKLAAKAAEAVALAEIKAIEQSENSTTEENLEKVTLTLEEYSTLKSKAQDAEESCNIKALEAALQVDEANVSKMDIMKRVEEAMDEVETSKQALEDALNRVEAANRAKLGVEEALRKWRSEHGERRRSIQNSTKFKNPYPSNRRRDSWVLDVNGVNLVSDAKAPVLKSTLSIGQILSQKLLITEEYESGKSNVKRKVSLGQMLGKQNAVISSAWKVESDCGGSQKQLPAKRKKLGFGRFSMLLPKQSKKKKQPTSAAR